jgi:hypothetical protein
MRVIALAAPELLHGSLIRYGRSGIRRRWITVFNHNDDGLLYRLRGGWLPVDRVASRGASSLVVTGSHTHTNIIHPERTYEPNSFSANF